MKKSYFLMLFIAPIFGFISACGDVNYLDISREQSVLAQDVVTFAQPSETPQAVADGSVCPISEKTPDKLQIKNDPDVEYVDLDREIKDFGTAFVVNKFFTSKATLFNFMKLVYGTIDEELKTYRATHGLDDRAIFLLFKGGNVMRIIANRLFTLLPDEARELLKTTYAENFKRSDADFSVFIDNEKLNGLDYEKVMSELNMMAYQALNKMRDEFTKDPKKFFDFAQLSQEAANGELQEYFQKINKLESLTKVENTKWYGANFTQMQILNRAADQNLECPYEGQNDYLYDFDANDKSNIVGTPLSKNSSWIMNTINKTLEYPSEETNPDSLIKFHLVRSKIQFEYVFMKDGTFHRKPIGAELVDVSFPHKDDFRLKKFFDNYDDWVADYELKFENESLTLKAESVNGLTSDLFDVVFEQFPRPWEAGKWEKRINRMFFLGSIDMLSTTGLGSETARTYFDRVEKEVLAPLDGLYPLKNESKAEVEKLQLTIEDITKNASEMKTANKIFEALGKLAMELLVTKSKDGDEENLKNFIKQIRDNVTTLKKLSDMPPATIDITQIYNATMDDLL